MYEATSNIFFLFLIALVLLARQVKKKKNTYILRSSDIFWGEGDAIFHLPI
jgi:hypothetical protein